LGTREPQLRERGNEVFDPFVLSPGACEEQAARAGIVSATRRLGKPGIGARKDSRDLSIVQVEPVDQKCAIVLVQAEHMIGAHESQTRLPEAAERVDDPCFEPWPCASAPTLVQR
jgi:hypothetical protein